MVMEGFMILEFERKRNVFKEIRYSLCLEEEDLQRFEKVWLSSPWEKSVFLGLASKGKILSEMALRKSGIIGPSRFSGCLKRRMQIIFFLTMIT
jgi:hypothetical protein